MKRHLTQWVESAELFTERSGGDALVPHRARRLGAGPRGRGEPRPSVDRKALQLCHQVAVTLDEVLAECGDTILQGLRVLDVEPAPDASRLLVTVALEDRLPGDEVDARQVQDHLAKAGGHLRSEVAGAITRKRAPVLIYRLAATPEI